MRKKHAYVVYCFIFGGYHLFVFSSNIFIDFSQTTWNFCTQFHHVHEKNMTQLFWYQNHSMFEKIWGDDVVDHVRHL